jgi:hypothetical protein
MLFKGCKGLGRLVIDGRKQSSSFVKALVSNLPSLKELEIPVQTLSLEVTDVFKECRGLEKLTIYSTYYLLGRHMMQHIYLSG